MSVLAKLLARLFIVLLVNIFQYLLSCRLAVLLRSGAYFILFLVEGNVAILLALTTNFDYLSMLTIIFSALICFFYFNLATSLQLACILILGSAFISDFLFITCFSSFAFNLSCFLDPISTILCILVEFIVLLCVLYLFLENQGPSFFVLCLLLIATILNEAFTTTDLFVFFVCFESVGAPMFLIILLWGSSRIEKNKANFLFFFYTIAGSLGFLFSLIFLWSVFRTTSSLVLDALPLRFQFIVWPLLFLAFAVKIPLFPFHSWLPQAHVEAPTVGSILLASLLLKLGGYGILRFITPFFHYTILAQFRPFVFSMVFCGAFFSSIAAVLSPDLKRIIAFSSIAHMSVCTFGFLTQSLTALISAFAVLISHGFVSGALFLLIGCLYDRTHTRLLRDLSGLAATMPFFAIYFLLFSLANIGFPFSFNFCAEFGLFLGLFQNNFVLGVCGALTIIFSGFFSMWLTNRLVFGGLNVAALGFFFDLSLLEISLCVLLFLPTLYFGIDFSGFSLLIEDSILISGCSFK